MFEEKRCKIILFRVIKKPIKFIQTNHYVLVKVNSPRKQFWSLYV